jgi:hypothetical protein
VPNARPSGTGIAACPDAQFNPERLMQGPNTAGVAEHDTVVCDIDVLNALLRGEVAAVETYDQVIPKFAGQPQAVELQRMRDEHEESAAVLRERVRHFGGDPVEGSGAWGKVAAAITGAAKIFGPASSLGALKQGEEYGIGQYESALRDPEVGAEDRELIRFRLLPRATAHSEALDRLVQEVKA